MGEIAFGYGSGVMSTLFHWFEVNANVLAVLVTVGVAVFLVCCLECCDSSGCKEDDIFRHHEM
jgi:glycerol uptake facilitator-like aquaporin